MAIMTRVKRISPMLTVADIDETVAFYCEVLGFSVVKKFPGYAIVECDAATIHLVPAADETVLKAVRGHTEIYIEVDDIAPLWTHVQTFKDMHPIRELVEQPYGMTEFHVGDPNGCLVFVGQKTTEPKVLSTV